LTTWSRSFGSLKLFVLAPRSGERIKERGHPAASLLPPSLRLGDLSPLRGAR
jgi:hypothetical protein